MAEIALSIQTVTLIFLIGCLFWLKVPILSMLISIQGAINQIVFSAVHLLPPARRPLLPNQRAGKVVKPKSNSTDFCICHFVFVQLVSVSIAKCISVKRKMPKTEQGIPNQLRSRAKVELKDTSNCMQPFDNETVANSVCY